MISNSIIKDVKLMITYAKSAKQKIYLIDNPKRTKPQYLNKNRLYLKENSSRMLGSILIKEICKIVN